MKTVEFEATITADGQISIPSGLAGKVPAGEVVHVVVQWEVNDAEEHVWLSKGRMRFEAAYAPEDHVYEHLIDGPPAR